MRNPQKTPRTLALALAALVAAALPAPLAGQSTPTEGYDPMRQITAQLVKANLLIVQDVTGSMADDIYTYGASNGQHAHGRLYWESQNENPVGQGMSDGTVRFNAKRVSNNSDQNRTFSGTDGVGAPGIYTYSYSGTTGPRYTDVGSGQLVYATSLPVLVYESNQFRLAYRCRPTGSWRVGGRLPWSSTVNWFYNDRIDNSRCSVGWGRGLYFTNPSRIMNVKNALGNSVYIANDYTPPAIPPSGDPVDRWNDAVWDSDWSTWVAREETPAGDTITYTEPYKTMGANPSSKSYRFRLQTGYDLVSSGSRYDPTPAGVGISPENPAARVNWISDPGDPFPAFHTSSTATPYKDKNGDDVRSPGLTSTGGEIPAGNWSLGWPTDTTRYGTVTVQPPGDVLGKNATRINFGLQTYSSSWSTQFPYLFPIDVYDTNNVERLQGFFAAYTDPNNTAVYSRVPREGLPINTAATNYQTVRIGITVTGGTNTKAALDFAKTIMERTFTGGSLEDNNNTWSLPADPKRTCLRTYGVILVTDGMSNNGNPAGGAWVDPTTTSGANAGQRVFVDVSREESNCPANWPDYAPQFADEIFRLKLDKGAGLPDSERYIYPRTWAIGISPLVGPCELDMIAYMGRTDASSPRGDAGFSGYRAPVTGDPGNPFLPPDNLVAGTYGAVNTNPIDGSAGTYDGPTGDRVWAPKASDQRPIYAYPGTYSGWTANVGSPSKPFWQWYRGTYRAPNDVPGAWWNYLNPANPNPPITGHGHNAFFANDAAALGEAFAAIVNATATGDYATNAPVSGMSANASNMVFLPSTDFPNWRGHLYAFDINKDEADPTYLQWDAGSLLVSADSDARKIFTWNPATNALVEVTAANLATAPLSGVPGLTAQVVDFIRGNDGAGNPRSWRLGPMVNSAPALVAAPGAWLQNTVVDHKSFQTTYASRDPLLWVGSNDGMLHAFRSTDGVEQIALLPPSLLWKQVALYNNFSSEPAFPTGQPPDILEHIYGVANSFRFGDVYDPVAGGYKTIGTVTLGAGGTELLSMDVTSIPRPDDASYPASPVSIRWTKTTGVASTGGALEQLGQTFSIPAMAPVQSNTWRLVGGSGVHPTNTAANQSLPTFVAPRTYVLDPLDGSVIQTHSLTSLGTPAPFVGNQAFADSVLFDPKAKAYQDDNVARLGLQADLNGQIWFHYSSTPGGPLFDQSSVGIDVSSDVTPSQSQPLYYNPAASGYGTGPTAGCVAYAFGSGTLYERSARITGGSIGTHPAFVPRLYVATANKASFTAKIPAANIASKDIASTWPLTNLDGTTTTITFGRRTQMTSPPFMLVPKSGVGTSSALFLLYDPDIGCNGFSYVAVIDFEGDGSCQPSNTSYMAYPAGVGAASGFTIAGDKVLVSKSGIGEGERASLFEPPNITAAVGGTAVPRVRWWRELK